jgi:hypothetical protein
VVQIWVLRQEPSWDLVQTQQTSVALERMPTAPCFVSQTALDMGPACVAHAFAMWAGWVLHVLKPYAGTTVNVMGNWCVLLWPCRLSTAVQLEAPAKACADRSAVILMALNLCRSATILASVSQMLAREHGLPHPLRLHLSSLLNLLQASMSIKLGVTAANRVMDGRAFRSAKQCAVAIVQIYLHLKCSVPVLQNHASMLVTATHVVSKTCAVHSKSMMASLSHACVRMDLWETCATSTLQHATWTYQTSAAQPIGPFLSLESAVLNTCLWMHPGSAVQPTNWMAVASVAVLGC